MTSPLKSKELDLLSYTPELSASMIYTELERYHLETIFDPLASTSGAAGYFKLQNIRIISNDFSLFTFVKGKALLENNVFFIPEEVLKTLTDQKARLPKLDHYKKLGGIYLTDIERKWLEYWRKMVNEIREEYIRALSETAVCLVIDHWITAKRFGETFEWKPQDLLKFYIGHVNRNVLDNEESNEMWLNDPTELAEKSVADVLFINPPGLKGYETFGIREQTLESWLRGTDDFPLSKIAPRGTLGSSFDSVGDYLAALSGLLKAAEHMPIWAFALSNRQPFTRLEFDELIQSLGRRTREMDLKIARQFFTRRAPDTIVIASV